MDISITISVPDAKMPTLKDAIADAGHYDASVNGTKSDFVLAEAKKVLSSWASDTYRHYTEKVVVTAADTDAEIS